MVQLSDPTFRSIYRFTPTRRGRPFLFKLVMTIKTAVRCDFEYAVQGDTHFCFNLQAAHTADQTVLSESLKVTPGMELREYEDPNNGNRFFRLDAPTGVFQISYETVVQIDRAVTDSSLPEVRISDLPDDVLHYLMPTRYCESDVMGRCAQNLFGNIPPGYGRINTICEWIRDNISYTIGLTTSSTSAQDVFLQRSGVCRDFAHLGITFCRALNIPARFVVGYVVFDEPPQDFHAVFEAWLGGRWVLFDPTGMACMERMVRVGTGRDAKDAAFSTVYGGMQMTRMEIQVNYDGIAPEENQDPAQATVLVILPPPAAVFSEAVALIPASA